MRAAVREIFLSWEISCRARVHARRARTVKVVSYNVHENTRGPFEQNVLQFCLRLDGGELSNYARSIDTRNFITGPTAILAGASKAERYTRVILR